MSLNDAENYLGDGLFSTDTGSVNFIPSKGTLWVVYINENFFDSSGCSPPQKLSRFIIKRKIFCLNSEHKKQDLKNKRDSYCAGYCLYIIYLTKVWRIDFISAGLNLYYQLIQ